MRKKDGAAVVCTIASLGDDPFNDDRAGKAIHTNIVMPKRTERAKIESNNEEGKILLFQALSSTSPTSTASEVKKEPTHTTSSIVKPPGVPPPPPKETEPQPPKKGRRGSQFGPFVLKESTDAPDVDHPTKPFRRPSLMQSPQKKITGLRGEHGFAKSVSGAHLVQRFGGL